MISQPDKSVTPFWNWWCRAQIPSAELLYWYNNSGPSQRTQSQGQRLHRNSDSMPGVCNFFLGPLINSWSFLSTLFIPYLKYFPLPQGFQKAALKPMSLVLLILIHHSSESCEVLLHQCELCWASRTGNFLFLNESLLLRVMAQQMGGIWIDVWDKCRLSVTFCGASQHLKVLEDHKNIIIERQWTM